MEFKTIVMVIISIILRIAAHNFFFFPTGVGQINEVPDDIAQAVFIKYPLDKRKHRVDAIHFFCQTIHPSPGIVKIVRGKKGAGFVVHAIADDANSIILKQFGNIAAVTNR